MRNHSETPPDPRRSVTKRCPDCGKVKTRADFHRASRRADGCQPACKVCMNRRRADWSRVNPGSVGVNRLWSSYRLRPEDWMAKLERQGGVCAVQGCGREPTCLDHDHAMDACEPDSHRGVLCNGCNPLLGRFLDSPEVLRVAVRYHGEPGRLRSLARYVESYRAHFDGEEA